MLAVFVSDILVTSDVRAIGSGGGGATNGFAGRVRGTSMDGAENEGSKYPLSDPVAYPSISWSASMASPRRLYEGSTRSK